MAACITSTSLAWARSRSPPRSPLGAEASAARVMSYPAMKQHAVAHQPPVFDMRLTEDTQGL
jgi:hypothetical protein